MDVIDTKNRMTGRHGVQQLHLTLANSQLDSGNTLIDHNAQDSVQSNAIDDKPNPDLLLKDSNESLVSGTESDAEDNSESSLLERPIGQIAQYDPTIDERLPHTVTLLTTPEGAKVYVVGTAHFSKESQDDVSMIIQAVQPHIVMVELCAARVHVLRMDEAMILKEAARLDFQTACATIREHGIFNGITHLFLLNISASMTKQLGMAPGGEFRQAFTEAKKIPNCIVQLGDRPINITLQRVFRTLSWWQSAKVLWNILSTRYKVTKEEVELCKQSDTLEELLAEMADFPPLHDVFVRERDLYLTHSLQLAAGHTINGKPVRVVGIVGIGHRPGIMEHWGKVQSSQIPPLLIIPPQPLSSRILRMTVKASLIGAIVYVGYKFLPLPSGATLQSFKSSVEGLLKVSVKR